MNIAGGIEEMKAQLKSKHNAMAKLLVDAQPADPEWRKRYAWLLRSSMQVLGIPIVSDIKLMITPGATSGAAPVHPVMHFETFEFGGSESESTPGGQK